MDTCGLQRPSKAGQWTLISCGARRCIVTPQTTSQYLKSTKMIVKTMCQMPNHWSKTCAKCPSRSTCVKDEESLHIAKGIKWIRKTNQPMSQTMRVLQMYGMVPSHHHNALNICKVCQYYILQICKRWVYHITLALMYLRSNLSRHELMVTLQSNHLPTGRLVPSKACGQEDQPTHKSNNESPPNVWNGAKSSPSCPQQM